MESYTHTPETFNIFYNQTNLQLKDHNDKIVKLTMKQEIGTNLESDLLRLHEKNIYLEERLKSLHEKNIYLEQNLSSLNKICMKFFAYGKVGKSVVSSVTQPVVSTVTQPVVSTVTPTFTFP